MRPIRCVVTLLAVAASLPTLSYAVDAGALLAEGRYRDAAAAARQNLAATDASGHDWRVLGDAHVDRAEANKTEFDEHFQRFITEGAWGSVWARPGLDPRTRSLLTLVLLAAPRAADWLTSVNQLGREALVRARSRASLRTTLIQ